MSSSLVYSTRILIALVALQLFGCTPTSIERMSQVWSYKVTRHYGSWAPTIAIGPDGGIMLASPISQQPDDTCILLEKLSHDGALLWSREYEHVTPPSAPWRPCLGKGFLAIDGEDRATLINTMIGGDAALVFDNILVKIDPSGNTLWATYPDGGAMVHHRPTGIVVDSQGNIIAIGAETQGQSHEMPWLAKYTADGAMLWTRAQPEFSWEVYAIRLDAEDNILLLTEGGNADIGQSRVVLEKLDSNGKTLWADFAPMSSFGGSGGFAVDMHGNVLIAAPPPENPSSSTTMSFVKYTANGTVAWKRDVASTFNGYADDGYPTSGRLTNVGMAPDGTIYGFGTGAIDRGVCHPIPQCFDGPCCKGDPARLFWKYDPAGNLVWVRFHDAPDAAAWSHIQVLMDEDKRLIRLNEGLLVDTVEAPK